MNFTIYSNASLIVGNRYQGREHVLEQLCSNYYKAACILGNECPTFELLLQD